MKNSLSDHWCRQLGKRFIVAGLFVSLLSTGLHAEDKKPAPKKKVKITFDEHIKPIFRAKCFACHNTDKKASGLDLTNYTGLMQGGAAGESLEPGDADGSYLYMLVTHESEPFMPPKSDKLPDKDLALIKAWIDGGAPENAGSKVVIKKPKFDFALKGASSGKPQGPPPMPPRMSLEPVVHTSLGTAVTALATNPWSPLAAVAGQKQILLYNTKTLELLGVLPFPEGFPQVLKFSRNGSLLLAGGGRAGASGRVVVWDVKTGKRLFTVGDELDSVLCADISSDQRFIALGSPSRVIRVYSTSTGELAYEIRKHTDWMTSLAFSPDSVLLCSGDRNGGAFVWEAATGSEYLTLKGHKGGITGISWRSDSNIVATSSEDQSVKLWELENGGNVKSWNAHNPGTSSIEFARDGRIVTCGRDRVTKIWDQAGKQLRALPAFADLAVSVTICDETNRVIAGDWTGKIKVWNAADGKEAGELTANPPQLSQRLTAATAALKSTQANHQKLLAVAQADKAAVAKVNADIVAAQKQQTDLQNKLNALNANLAASQKALTGAQGNAANSTKKIAAINAPLAAIKEAHAKANTISKKVAGDKDLAEAAAKLKAALDKRVAANTAEQKNLATHQATVKANQQKIAQYTPQIKQMTAALNAAKAKLAGLQKALKPATDKATASQNAANAAASAFTASQNQVKRWQAEIEFAKKFNETQASASK
ncbi:c-type cytochrome domain-containing protein [Gimesia aquarii]|uniref:Chromosome partition protein Smc n=1 Tax=Gimesia aquarii TaxID=2527964 RepID=A0A517WU73_9PLAN|nr:c-type cytochrome domain-containing protein [Gimesia aquarii]QDU08810.1 Chromosome partition protein Smc [Gimesia aquarii]